MRATNVDVSAPVIVTPRGLPGVKLGNDYVSIDYACMHAGRFDYYLDLADGSGWREMTPPSPGRYRGGMELQQALGSLLMCMTQMGIAGDPPIKNLMRFPYGVARWAVDHHPELVRLMADIGREQSAGHRLIAEGSTGA